MTRFWRLPTALLISIGLLLAFSSTALPYKLVFEQQVIPDGADDPDYSQAAGGSSPIRSRPGSTSSGTEEPSSLHDAAHVCIEPDFSLDALRGWKDWLVIFRTGVHLGASLL